MRWLPFLVACGSAAAPGGFDLGHAPGVCFNQDDCVSGTICEPAPLGAASGSCRPPSKLHCAGCAADSDCGPEGMCFQAPGDDTSACHVDCSLSWLACPSGYNCSAVILGGAMRQVCLPVENRCADAGGSTCTNGDSQPCSRTNAAGTCTGVRLCESGQLGTCGAPDPVFLDHCGDAAPAGCTEMPSAAALSTASDCGACGNACPGVASSTADAACVNGTCGIGCIGDNYDVDGNATNGCEVADAQTGNHDQTTATALPGTSCDDSSSQNSFTGHILSDARVHTGATGFDPSVGAVPHWFSVYSSGGLCTDDYSVTLTTTGGGAVPCYSVTILTDKITDRVTTTGSGSNTISSGASSYSDGSTIYFRVEKTCSATSVGGADVSYTVSYHL